MTLKYLLDTNIIAEPLRPAPNEKIVQQLQKHQSEIAIPSILPYTQPAAEWHASERARLTSIGKPPPFADGQIIAIAKTNDLILVTLNTTDYTAFEGVQLEDWQTET